jgi:hypothetical protein
LVQQHDKPANLLENPTFLVDNQFLPTEPMATESQFQSKSMQDAMEVYHRFCHGKESGTLEHLGNENFRSTPLIQHFHEPLGGFTPQIAKLTLVMLDHRSRK